MPSAKPEKFAHRPPEITILSDHPARRSSDEPSDYDRDLLGFESKLSSVFDILRHKNTQCPLTVALYGDWGTGKTSAMRWLQNSLLDWNKRSPKNGEEHPRVHPVWFDPWRYHSREEVWRGIIAEVILTLFNVQDLDRQDIVQRMAAAAKKFGAFLGRGFLHALANTELEIKPSAAGTEAGSLKFKGEAFREIWEEYDKANHPEKAHLNQFEDTLASWVHEFLPKKDGVFTERIVIFIDDLDRCMPEVTLEVLEALKLYLAIEPLVFVVGLDRHVVDAVVAQHYDKSGVAKDKARHYLNKIFQVELTIPPSEEQMGSFMAEQIKALNKATSGYWEKMLTHAEYRAALENTLRDLARHNPREVKRLLNNALLRGRAAAMAPELDEKLGKSYKDRSLRFAQGTQVLLLQRLVHDWLVNADNLFLTKRHVEWFKTASDLYKVIKEKKHNITPTIVCDELRMARETRESEKNVAGGIIYAPPNVQAILDHLSNNRPIDDTLKPLDLKFFELPMLWTLLSVPFSTEVAQSVPKSDVLGMGAEKQFKILLSECSPELREALAQATKQPVDTLNTESLRSLNKLNLETMPITDVDCRLLGQLSSLRTLWLGKTLVTDAGVMLLNKLPALSNLALESTKLTDAGVVNLSKFPALESLWLSNNQVTDVGVAHLSKLSRLITLSINETPLTDVSAENVSKLSSLQCLRLSGTKITDVGAEHLSKLSALKDLWLDDTKLTDAGVTHLGKLSLLQNLWLDGTRLTDVGMAHISKLSALKDLSLNYTQLTDAGMEYFSKLSQLQTLRLNGTHVTDVGIGYLRKLSTLKDLRLNNTQITDASLAYFSSLSALKDLSLVGTKISAKELQKLKNQIPNLKF